MRQRRGAQRGYARSPRIKLVGERYSWEELLKRVFFEDGFCWSPATPACVCGTAFNSLHCRESSGNDYGFWMGYGGRGACAAILATHHVIQREKLVAAAAALGAYAKAKLPVPVRGEGALLGLCFDRPCKPIVAALRERGFITGGSDDPNIMRVMPPLNTPLEAIDELADALKALA